MILQIDRGNPFDPEEFLGAGWGFWRGSKDGDGLEGDLEEVEKSRTITQIDLSRVQAYSGLEEGELNQTGDVIVSRLEKEDRDIVPLDLDVFQVFWNDKPHMPQCFRHTVGSAGVTFVFFDGQTLRSPEGKRVNMCMYQDHVGIWSFQTRERKHLRSQNTRSAIRLL